MGGMTWWAQHGQALKYRRRRQVGHEADENAGKTWAIQHGPQHLDVGRHRAHLLDGCEPRWVGNLAYKGKVQELLGSRGFTLHKVNWAKWPQSVMECGYCFATNWTKARTSHHSIQAVQKFKHFADRECRFGPAFRKTGWVPLLFLNVVDRSICTYIHTYKVPTEL